MKRTKTKIVPDSYSWFISYKSYDGVWIYNKKKNYSVRRTALVFYDFSTVFFAPGKNYGKWQNDLFVVKCHLSSILLIYSSAWLDLPSVLFSRGYGQQKNHNFKTNFSTLRSAYKIMFFGFFYYIVIILTYLTSSYSMIFNIFELNRKYHNIWTKRKNGRLKS